MLEFQVTDLYFVPSVSIAMKKLKNYELSRQNRILCRVSFKNLLLNSTLFGIFPMMHYPNPMTVVTENLSLLLKVEKPTNCILFSL